MISPPVGAGGRIFQEKAFCGSGCADCPCASIEWAFVVLAANGYDENKRDRLRFSPSW